MMFTIGFVLAICLVMVVKGVRKFHASYTDTFNALADIKPKFEEKYGHPKPPVSTIRDRLPKVEYPYMWESWVDSTPASDKFTLQLVNAADDNKVEATRTINLRASNIYAGYRYILDELFEKHVIRPEIEWATNAALRCNYTPERTNYKIG